MSSVPPIQVSADPKTGYVTIELAMEYQGHVAVRHLTLTAAAAMEFAALLSKAAAIAKGPQGN